MTTADDSHSQAEIAAAGARAANGGKKKGNKKPRTSNFAKRDPSKHCSYCGIDGHDTSECRSKAKAERWTTANAVATAPHRAPQQPPPPPPPASGNAAAW